VKKWEIVVESPIEGSTDGSPAEIEREDQDSREEDESRRLIAGDSMYDTELAWRHADHDTEEVDNLSTQNGAESPAERTKDPVAKRLHQQF